MSLSARVTIEAGATKDPRFQVLGVLIGSTRQHALGCMIDVWEWCTVKETDSLPPAIVAAFLGVGIDEVSAAVVEAELGEVVGDLIRIRGCRGRTEWLGKLKSRNRKGGVSRAKKAKRAGGKFVSTSPPPATNQPKHQPTTSEAPANTSAITITSTSTITKDITKKRSGLTEPGAVKEEGYPMVVARYFELYELATGKKPRWSGRQGKELKSLLAVVDDSEICRRLEYMFSGASWLKPPFTFGSLINNWDSMVPAKKTRNPNGAVSGDDLRAMAEEARKHEQGTT